MSRRSYFLAILALLLLCLVPTIEIIGTLRMRGREAVSVHGSRMTIRHLEFHPQHWPPFVYCVTWHVQAPRFLWPGKGDQVIYEIHHHQGYCYVDEARFEE